MATLPARRALLAMAATFALACVAPLGSARADSPVDTRARVAASSEVTTDPSLRPAASRGGVDVLVSYQDDRALRGLRSATSTAARKWASDRARDGYAAQKRAAMAALRGVSVKRDYASLPVQLVHVESAAALEALAARPGVASLSPNRVNTINPQRVVGASVSTADQVLIKQPEAVDRGWDGAGVRVAVLDTGVAPNLNQAARDLFGNCSSGPGTGTCRIASFRDVVTGATAPVDVHVPGYHGTNVSGIVATTAPGAKLDVYNVFRTDSDGDVIARDSDLIAALNDVAATAIARNIRAVNLSLGEEESYYTSTCTSSGYSASFATLRAHGVLPVVAAGNYAYDAFGDFQNGVSAPACARGAVAVGATYTTTLGPVGWGLGCYDNALVDTVTCFSQTGPLLDVLAPGVDITAAGVRQSGTSQATPHVAGAIADLASAKPDASVGSIEAAIKGAGPVVSDSRSGTAVRRLDIDAAGRLLVGRISGPNRYATSAAISRRVFPQTNVALAYVASGENFPDALSAGPAAGYRGAPLLLARPNLLPSEIRAELQRLRPNRIVILGGNSSIGAAVANELRSLARDTVAPVSRVAGSDRYATSALISQGTFPSGVGVAYVASGANYPDALAGGPLAGQRGGPLLITPPTALPASVRTELSRLSPAKVVVLGGNSSVSAAVMADIRALVGASSAVRIAGADRYETAARASADHFAGGAPGVFVASGRNFPDALSAAPAAARLNVPVLLTVPTPLSAATATEVARLNPDWGYVLGGTSSVSNVALLQAVP